MNYSKGLTTSGVLLTVVGAGLLAVGCSSTAHSPVGATRPDIHTAPTHVRWTDFQGVQVPVADQGPQRIDGVVATGYDSSPQGAALAAIESTVRMSIADDSQWTKAGQQLLVAGPGRDRWATARVQVSIAGPVREVAAPHLLGYTVTDYSPAKADIAIFTRQVDGSLTSNAARVIRHNSTWLLDLPAKPGMPSVSAVARTPQDMVNLAATTKEPPR
ncbi:hypothetical protein [Nocardia jiangxiensis]|uniref:hypothetical protein n=1 Tax=Nocardia jiangxiensis TaxID=282685 RepID=UPI0012F6689E|nr:hypothetical protein [Nocardia jiangxiensis]